VLFYLVHTLHDYKSIFTGTHALLFALLLHAFFALLGQNLSLQTTTSRGNKAQRGDQSVAQGAGSFGLIGGSGATQPAVAAW